MLDDIRLTKRERDLINDAFNSLETFTRSRYELDHWAQQERKGYGNAHDKVPLIVSRALCLKWFLYGATNPDTLLRDAFALRPAAVYMTGLGARAAHSRLIAVDVLDNIRAACAAYAAAFDAMHQRDLAALRAASMAVAGTH